MIITIDGPAGAGKSSAAKALAKRLGFEFLDTGAMYRAVTLKALRTSIDLHHQASLEKLVQGIRLEMPPGKVLLDGEDVAGLIRTAEVTNASGPISSSAVVRSRLVELQRQIAAGRDMVCEGRDQGTVVFPDSPCKFFLVADPAERARRRQSEMTARGEAVSIEKVLKDQEVRDTRDASRDVAPMVPAKDAIMLDSTHLTLDEVVERMYREVMRRKNSGGKIQNPE